MKLRSYRYFKGMSRRLTKMDGNSYDGPWLWDGADTGGMGPMFDAPFAEVYEARTKDEPELAEAAHEADPYDEDSMMPALNAIYRAHQNEFGGRPLGKFISSMSTGDVIVLTFVEQPSRLARDPDERNRDVEVIHKAFRVDSVGFSRVAYNPFSHPASKCLLNPRKWLVTEERLEDEMNETAA